MEVALIYAFTSSNLFIDTAYQLMLMLPKMVLKSGPLHCNPLVREEPELNKSWGSMDVILFVRLIGEGGKLVFLFPFSSCFFFNAVS